MRGFFPRFDARRVYWLLALLLLAYGIANLWAGSRLVGQKYGGFLWIHDLSRTPPYYVGPMPWRTLQLAPDTLQFVDTLLQIEGQPVETAAAVYAAHQPGELITYQVRRGQALLTIAEPLRLFSFDLFLLIHGMLFLVGASALGSGWLLLGEPLRPYLAAISFSLLVAAGAAFFFVGEYTHLAPAVTASLLPWLLLGAPAAAMIGGLFLYAALCYPEPGPFLQRFPRFPWLLLGLPLPGVVAWAFVSQSGWREASEVLLRGLQLYGAICFVAVLFVSVTTYRRLRQAGREPEFQAMKSLIMAALLLMSAVLVLWLGPYVFTGRPILPYEVLAAFLAALPVGLVYALHNAETLRLLYEEVRLRSAQAEQIDLLRRSRDRTLHQVADRLHDYVLPELRGAQMLAARLQRRQSALPVGSQEDLAVLANGLQTALAHAQKLVEGAKPVDWSAVSLCTALEQIAERYRRRNVEPVIEVDAAGYDEADEAAVKDALLIVAQLALDNAIRHAEARCIRLRLCSTGGMVQLEVGDDGKGFVVEDVLHDEHDRRHLGLSNIRLRSQEIGATISITSSPGQGACVRLALARP